MKILHVNTSDINGGAARAAYRLHRALLDKGVLSQMFVQSKTSDDPTVFNLSSKIAKGASLLRPKLDQLPLLQYSSRKKTLFSPSWVPFSGIVKKIQEINPDVVHLHWIAGGFLRIEQLARINKPIVWSLHDMWAFTGGCHYDKECGRFRDQCGNCPVLGFQRANDLSRKVFLRKEKTYSKLSNLVINGLSSWLANCAKSSALLQGQQVVNIPNPIDTDKYKPLSKRRSKEIVGLNSNKKHVLFGAMNATTDLRKGFIELMNALHNLKTEDVELVVFGANSPDSNTMLPFTTKFIGTLHDDISLRILYNAADVMVVPSKQENLSNAILESLACGTPTVGFRVGGNIDMISHKKNGYLAKPFDAQDMACGIDFCLRNSEADELCKNARDKILDSFEASLVANRYIALYKSIIDGTC
jgi:glycosyltransferase involved in cell wall biosynthesis